MVGPNNNLHSNTVIILLIHLFIPHPAANLCTCPSRFVDNLRIALSALRCECVLDWPWHVLYFLESFVAAFGSLPVDILVYDRVFLTRYE